MDQIEPAVTPNDETLPAPGQQVATITSTSRRQVKPANQALYRANLEQFGPEMAELLEKHPERPVPVEEDVKITGLKNPVYLVIIGFAGLQVLKAARKAKKEIQNVLIIEPSLGVFKHTIQREWVGDLACDELVDLLIGIPPEDMLPHIVRIFTETDRKGPRVNRCLMPEFLVDPFLYVDEKGKALPIADQITQVVLQGAKQVVLSMGCASDSHYRWEQMIRNEKNLERCYRIEPQFGQFKDVPAVVIGAGPSLKEFIDAYVDRPFGDRALLIACDASLRRLLDAGIRPHLVTRCERKLTPIFRGVEKGDTADIFYAAYPWTDPAFFDLFDESFMLYRGNGVCKWTDPYHFGNVDGGVSSANAGLELAYLLGAKEIYLTGVDLCFLDGKSHAEGTQVEFDPENSKSKWREIPSNSGGKVTTIPVWERCLGEYRMALMKHPGVPVYNTSPQGAVIQGAKVVPWQEVLERIHHGEVKQSPLKTMRSRMEKHAPGYAESFKTKKKETVKRLKQGLLDLEKLFGSIDDQMLLCKREEEKVVRQIKAYTDPTDFFQNSKAIQKSLSGVYVKCCKEIDVFKKQYYHDPLFGHLLLDICMVDLQNVEHRCHGLPNLVELDHDRLKMYVGLHIGLFRTLEFYALKLVDLLENGANLKVNYDEITVGVPA